MPEIAVLSPLNAARSLAPQIRSCAEAIETERELPRSLFETMADAGLFHMAVPRALGGAEIDLPTYIQVIEEIGKADASAAWMTNQTTIFGTHAARMPHDVARAIWIDTPRCVISNTPSPTAQAVVVPGGFRVTGEQGFSTGCRHASWIASRAQIIEQGQPRRSENGQPETRFLFVPVDEAELLDTWHVRGLRGTGTHHFAVRDVFCPRGAHDVGCRGASLRDRSVIPTPSNTTVCLGRCRSCLGHGTILPERLHRAGRGQDAPSCECRWDAARSAHGASRRRSGGRPNPRRPGTANGNGSRRVGHGEHHGHGQPRPAGRGLRIAATHTIRLAVEAVDIVYNAAGATSIYDGHPIQRAFQDIHVISQHVQSRRAHYELVGRYWLGVPVQEGRF